MTSILLYRTPNKHTIPVDKAIRTGIRFLDEYPHMYTTTPVHHAVAYKVNIGNGITEDERYIVGTQCGTQPYLQQRVDEYNYYRQNPDAVLKLFNYDRMAIHRYFYGDVVM